jgi:hypothetical protein
MSIFEVTPEDIEKLTFSNLYSISTYLVLMRLQSKEQHSYLSWRAQASAEERPSPYGG